MYTAFGVGGCAHSAAPKLMFEVSPILILHEPRTPVEARSRLDVICVIKMAGVVTATSSQPPDLTHSRCSFFDRPRHLDDRSTALRSPWTRAPTSNCSLSVRTTVAACSRHRATSGYRWLTLAFSTPTKAKRRARQPRCG